MIYLANCRAPRLISLQLTVGSRLPILRTAMGLACLAAMQPEKRDEIVKQLLAADPDRAMQIRATVARAVAEHHELGYVGSYGTWFSYINAIGVSFRATDGSPLVSLTCGGIVDMFPRIACETTVKVGVFH